MRHSDRRSNETSNELLSRLAPLARHEIFPNVRVKRVTTRLDSLKSACRITNASVFSAAMLRFHPISGAMGQDRGTFAFVARVRSRSSQHAIAMTLSVSDSDRVPTILRRLDLLLTTEWPFRQFRSDDPAETRGGKSDAGNGVGRLRLRRL